MNQQELLKTIPESIGFTDKDLRVTWKDGHESVWNLLKLRKECPCAVCRGGDFGPIGAKTGNITEAKLVSFNKVGRYALNFIWQDGHTTGIHTYDRLRASCECPDCQSGGK